ncbi:MAG: arginine N-succinyltransferase [Oceanococcus sp.]
MLVVRPVKESDLVPLQDLVSESGIGMTSLPKEDGLLQDKIELSIRSFAATTEQQKSSEMLFFFVLEDSDSGRLAGTSAIKSGIGLSDPFYSYRLDKLVHASSALGVHKVMPTLYLNNDYTGAAEIASLFLASDYRKGGNGHLLSKGRFLFLAQFYQRFPDKLIADMRGVSDEDGRSPFWDALGQHFFSMDFPLADRLSGSRSKSFIAELMPRHPIYVPLMPAQAQAVIGQVHSKTQPAREILEREGFRYKGYVDIFDAGPTLEADLLDIRAVRDSRLYTVQIQSIGNTGPMYLLSNTQWGDFRCGMGCVELNGDRVKIDAEMAAALSVGNGGSVRVVSSKPVAAS